MPWACRTTQLDPPEKLLYSEEFDSFSDARKREAQVKRWSRTKKEALISADMVKLRSLAKSRKAELNSNIGNLFPNRLLNEYGPASMMRGLVVFMAVIS